VIFWVFFYFISSDDSSGASGVRGFASTYAAPHAAQGLGYIKSRKNFQRVLDSSVPSLSLFYLLT